MVVLRAANGGGYPYGNSLLVREGGETLLVDPSRALVDTPEALGADAVVVSHAHEDHLVGRGASSLPVHVHEADVGAVRSAEVLLDGSGLPDPAAQEFGRTLAAEFRIRCADAAGVADGHQFDLGNVR